MASNENGRANQAAFTGQASREAALAEAQKRQREEHLRQVSEQQAQAGRTAAIAQQKRQEFTGKRGRQAQQVFSGQPGVSVSALSTRGHVNRQVRQMVSGEAGGAVGSDGNTDKNQSSLALGSAGYRERLRDKAGIEEENFVGQQALQPGVPVGHVKLAEGARKESDKYQEALKKPEAEHVQEFAGELGRAAQQQRDADQAVAVRKYRNQMAKMDQYPRVIREMEVHAEHTETKKDDKAVAKLKGRDCSDMPEIIDDGVTLEDFMGRAFDKYM